MVARSSVLFQWTLSSLTKTQTNLSSDNAQPNLHSTKLLSLVAFIASITNINVITLHL